MNAISLSHLSFSRANRLILEAVNLSVEIGEFIGLVGPNGGGKTTLLKLLMGFFTPTRGSIRLFGKPPVQSRHRIGYVPQRLGIDRLFPITVRELILLGAPKQRLFYPPEVEKRAQGLMKELGLASYAEEPFASLSGGFAQRALFARALLSDPDLLLLDEPTANVDTTSTSFLLNWLETLKGKKTILLVTHDLRTALERVDRILCVERCLTSLKKEEVCEHFALGLYHTPLLGLPHNHFNVHSNAPPCALSR